MTKLDFTIIEKAGVSQGQFGRLCGVSRITVNTWATGARAPAKHRLQRVSDALDLLSRATATGQLPVPAQSHVEKTQVVLDSLARSRNRG
jgi:transcriptional regulator with XRE-family HTH domain